jgi:hypothetical protein
MLLNKVGEKCPNVERVAILSETTSELREETCQQLQSSCPNLKEMTLWGVNIDPDFIHQLLSHQVLSELTIYYHPGTFTVCSTTGTKPNMIFS